MKRVKLIVAYDGSRYCGWQIQKNGITVEQVLNEQLSRLLKEEIHVIGASRTDAGVHALGNVAVFDTNTRIPGEKIAYALNQSLPADIRIQGSKEVEADFHPRYRNSTKTYEYRIYNGPFEVPLLRNNTYFFHRKLDVEKMRQAAEYLMGEHDFAAFCSAHAQVRETTRTIYSVSLETEMTGQGEDAGKGQLIRFRISGNGFLYNMVRIIVGTLLQVGIGKYPPGQIKQILDGGRREEAGPCAPAKGLTLIGIEYEQSLADELHVYNERMHYSLVQRDIPTRQEACLRIFRCEQDWLLDLIVRMTKKAFRLGARRMYVSSEETPMLSEVLAPSKRNGYTGGEFFTAGDYRFVLDHKIRQMDRDLRACPPKIRQVSIKPLQQEQIPLFCRMYNKCFYAQPCTVQLTEEEAAGMCREVYFAWQEEAPAGFVALKEADWDPDALLVWAIGTEGRYRKKGIGSALLEWACAEALKRGKKRVTLEVSSRNKKALSLYEKAGFYQIRRKKKYWYRCDDQACHRKEPEKS